MNRPLYKKTNNGWQFRFEGEDILFEADKIAIMFEVQNKATNPTVTIHKHGPLATVQENLKRFQDTYKAAGQQELADAFEILDVTHANEENLNILIQSTQIPQKKIQDLANPFRDVKGMSHPVPLTRDMSEEVQYIIKGERLLINSPLLSKPKVLDLDLILKEANIGKINPKEFTGELVVWADGTEVCKDDFIPEEYNHMSDDYETVTDLDEDLRALLNKEISKATDEHKGFILLLPPPTRAVTKDNPTETRTYFSGVSVPPKEGQPLKSEILSIICSIKEPAEKTNLRIAALDQQIAYDRAVEQNIPKSHLETSLKTLRSKILEPQEPKNPAPQEKDEPEP